MGFVVLGLIEPCVSWDVKFSVKKAFEGDSLTLHEVLTNNKFLPLSWVFIEFRLSKDTKPKNENNDTSSLDSNYQSDMFSIMMYKSMKRKLTFVCSKCDLYRLRNITMIFSKLLYSVRFVKNLNSSAELTVFPKLLDGHKDVDVICKTWMPKYC